MKRIFVTTPVLAAAVTSAAVTHVFAVQRSQAVNMVRRSKTVARTAVAVAVLAGVFPPGIALSQAGRSAGSATDAAASMPPPLLWIRRPDADDLMSAFPPVALRSGLSGYAVMSCAATTDGRLARCGILAEAPPGAGFGPAVLTLAPYFKVKPQRPGDSIEGVRVVIPIHFAAPPR